MAVACLYPFLPFSPNIYMANGLLWLSLDPKCTGGTAFPTFSKPSCPTSSETVSNTLYPTVTAIATIIQYTTTNLPGGAVTVIKTSTSTSYHPIPTISIIINGTHPNTTAPTPSAPTPPTPLFTGAGVRNFAEVGVMALVVAVGAVLL